MTYVCCFIPACAASAPLRVPSPCTRTSSRVFWANATAPPSAICARRAASSIGGKGLPLFSARRSIPEQAFGLKEYLCRPFELSKDSDSKETAPALGHSEELRVQNSPSDSVSLATSTPDASHLPEEALEVCPPRATERTWHVLPDPVSRQDFRYRPYVLKHESGSALKALSLSCDGEALAGASSDHNVNWSMLRDHLLPVHLGNVPEVRHLGIAMREHR